MGAFSSGKRPKVLLSGKGTSFAEGSPVMRKTARRLAIMLSCTLGLTVAGLVTWSTSWRSVSSARADEPIKTGKTRDTLLYVRTDPPGATVFLDGKKMGISGGLFRVESGVSTVRIELDGHKTDSRELTIRAERVTRLELTLEPAAKPAEEKEAAPPRPPPHAAKSRQPATSIAMVKSAGIREASPTARSSPRLRYRFQAGKQYACEIKIEAELEDTIETREGVSVYDVLSADEEQMVLKQSGGLRRRRSPALDTTMS